MTTISTGFDSHINRALAGGHAALAQRMIVERTIATALVKAILDRGYLVSIHDGEAWSVRRSTDLAAILPELAATDMDMIRASNADNVGCAAFTLIYGNTGYDVVSDYSDNDLGNEIWARVIEPLANQAELEMFDR